MMGNLTQMAQDLGREMGRTDEYKALKRAMDQAEEDREVVELRNKLQELEEEIHASLKAGQQPDEEKAKEYEEVAGQLQSKPAYQQLVAAQSNFDKVVQEVNQTIAQGIKEGGDSPIVTPS